MSDYKIPFIKDKIIEVLTSETVGFSRIPEQARKTSVERGFYFNLMVIGRRRSGTRTLINNLFLSPILNDDRPDGLSTTCAQITENGVKLNVRITTCHEFDEKQITDYLQNMNFSYFEQNEGISKIDKINETDKRVHMAIFLLSTDHVTDEEMKVVKSISEHTNLLCVIGKADTYMDNELILRKKEIQKLLQEWNIKTFRPAHNFDLQTVEDKPQISQEKPINVRRDINLDQPLAIIASESLFKINGQTRRGRLYRWGFVDVNDLTYNDFLILRRILIGSNMEEIKETFENKFYETYRLEQFNKKETILKHRTEKFLELFSEWQQISKLKYDQPIQIPQVEEAQPEDVFAIIENES
ncbi:Septin family protein (P-loop GTPase) [Pseudoloma neurophilia]|uniref:Septin family protein (P-loop GTPase) n=1 Tax=Pseudoloma neurophilia TaxID=146866 RepID=A0A0R0M481_9MICR|nr:Septin family protein (P-loop GTPase) [Pseudoloma neurophilia]